MVADVFALVFYLGGALAFVDAGRGFWDSLFWPYELGKHLAHRVMEPHP